MTARLKSARWEREERRPIHRWLMNWQWINRRLANGIKINFIGLLITLSMSVSASSPETLLAQPKTTLSEQPTTQPSINNQSPSAQQIPLLRFEGAIGPAISEYLVSEIAEANQLPTSQRPPLLMITMDTPGGLVSSLRIINQAILASNIPIACLVSPSGARAMSAGTYMLYACHIAAMAPATTLGAATPVKMGGPTSPPPNDPSPNDASPTDQGDMNGKGESNKGDRRIPTDNNSAMERKILNDAVANIRALARLRNRNIEFAERAVTEAATLTATEALAQNVINYIANDGANLLTQLDGIQVDMGEQRITLTLSNAQLIAHDRSWRNHFIATITDPNIAYILMLIGIYGLLLEFYSPGVGVAGVTGAISLLIALYAFQLLPINYVGLGLMLLGITLLIAESMVPSFGIFGLGGAVAFALGSIFLIDSELEHFAISLPLIGAVTVTALLFSLWVLTTMWRQRHRKIVSGDEAIVGAQATVVEGFIEKGFVILDGENWAAVSDEPTHTDQQVMVVARDQLILKVTPALARSSKEITNGRN